MRIADLDDAWKSTEEKEKNIEREIRVEEHHIKKEVAKEKILEKLAEDYFLNDDLPDEEKAKFIALYNEWEVGVDYTAGERIAYNEKVFEVVQAHTSQSDWKPDTVPALFRLVYQTETTDGTPVIPDWVQPTGTHDAYNIGDMVLFNGEVFESLIDGNTWSPTAYPAGWESVSHETLIA